MLSVLLGCGLGRSEVAALKISDIQRRDDRSVIVDLVRQAGHVRTVPVLAWVKSADGAWPRVFQLSPASCSGQSARTAPSMCLSGSFPARLTKLWRVYLRERSCSAASNQSFSAEPSGHPRACQSW
jgi:integrase